MPRELALAVPFPLAVEPVGVGNDLPPHVTVLIPAPDDVRRIGEALAPFTAFQVTFSRFGRFPNGLWLAPEPAQPFVVMTEALMRSFPGYLPYGGAFAGIVPHLTVAQSRLDETEALIAPLLPVASRAERVVLYERADGDHWRDVHAFEL
ncbi:MAG: 2'-5' RNA ligase family protein [Gaiellaceae bacterium]